MGLADAALLANLATRNHDPSGCETSGSNVISGRLVTARVDVLLCTSTCCVCENYIKSKPETN